MFNSKINILKISLFLFIILKLDLNAADEFDYNLLNEKINRLEQEISDIHKSLYVPDNNVSIKEDTKNISSKYQRRINKLENDFAKINGKLEEIFFRLDQLQSKLDKFTSDVDFRLSTQNDDSTGGLPLTKKDRSSREDTSTGGLPIAKKDRSDKKDTIAYPDNNSDVNASGGDVEILGTIDKKDVIDESFEIARNFQTPEDLFNYGKDALRNLNYSDAENAFKGFVKKYPKNKNVPDAYFWLGESLFVSENFQEAVLAYGEVIKTYKKHIKRCAHS